MKRLFFIVSRGHRAVSPVIAALIMLSIVATVGSMILLQGMAGITNFTTAIDFQHFEETASVQENLIVEHVRFDPNSDEVKIWVRNVGTNEVTINQITMVKIDTQDLIINDGTVVGKIFFKEAMEFTPTIITLPVGSGEDQKWSSEGANGKDLKKSKYRITITTAHGNLFDSVVTPYNT